MGWRRPRWLLDLLTWALSSILLLGVGLAALAIALVAWGAAHTGHLPGDVQRQAWLLLARTLFEQALLPLWAATLASWLAIVRLAPRLDRGWHTLAPGVASIAALWFAPVGAYSFRVWTPVDLRDVLGTLALCAGGVSAALLIPRLALRRLAPGVFAAPAASRGA